MRRFITLMVGICAGCGFDFGVHSQLELCKVHKQVRTLQHEVRALEKVKKADPLDDARVHSLTAAYILQQKELACTYVAIVRLQQQLGANIDPEPLPRP